METVREPAPVPPHAKRVLVVIAGAFDPPGQATPLEEAEKPAMDRMARAGRAGVVALAADSPWDGFVALLGLGAAAPSLGAAEALGAAIDVHEGEIAYRADFVTVGERGLNDPFGGRVKDPEATLLLDAIRNATPGVRLFRAGGHRNVALLRGPAQFCPSPWEMVGQRPAAALPSDGPVREVHDAAVRAIAAHDVNAVRIDLGENPANALWLHGGGPRCEAGPAGAAPSGGAHLVGRGAATAGLARAMGWPASLVDGDDDVLAAATLAAIATSDLVVVRTESVLDAGAIGGAEAKRDALSRVDARLVAPVLAALEERDAHVMVVAGDCVIDATSHALVRHPVPFVLSGRGGGVGDTTFTERASHSGGYHLGSGAELFALLAGR